MIKKLFIFLLLIVIGLGGAYYLVNKEKLTGFNAAVKIVKQDYGKIRDKFIENTAQAIKAKPLEFNAVEDVEWNEKTVEGLISQEDFGDTQYSGSFYFGNFDGLSEFSKKYSQARNAKTDLIIHGIDETIGHFEKLEDVMKKQRGLFDWYILKIMAFEDTAADALLDLTAETQAEAMNNNLKLQNLLTLKDELKKMKKSPGWGYLQQAKYTMLFTALQSYANEMSELTNKFLAIYYQLESDPNPTFKSINRELDESMAPLADEAGGLLAKIAANTQILREEENRLKTGDYYFVQEMVIAAEAELPKLQQKIDSYNGSKSILDEKDLAFLQDYKDLLESQITALRKYIDEFDSGKLAKPNQQASILNLFFPETHAFISSAFEWVTGDVPSMESGMRLMGDLWETTKGTMVDVKDGIVGGAKFIGAGIGVTLDTIDAVHESSIAVQQAILFKVQYGDDFAPVFKEVANSFGKIGNNFIQGKSGAETYGEGIKLMDSIENGVGNTMALGVEQYVGKGMISESVGFVGKTATNFLTGFSKNLYETLDPSKNDAETLAAMAALSLSFVGGSASAVNGTQAMGTTLKVTKGAFANADDVLIKVAQSNAYQKIYSGGPKDVIKQFFTKEGVKEFKDGVANAGKKAFDQFKNNTQKGYEAVRENIKGNTPETFKNWFTKNNSTALEALEQLMGTAGSQDPVGKFIGFFNNIVGNVIDDEIKADLKSGFQEIISKDPREKTQIIEEVKKGYEYEIENMKKEQQTQHEETEKPEEPGIYDVTIDMEDDEPETSLYDVTLDIEDDKPSFTGDYSANFDRSSSKNITEEGITASVTDRTLGYIMLKVNTNNQATCTIELTTTLTTQVAGQSIPVGAGKGSATSCAGVIDNNGNFNLFAEIKGDVTALTVKSSGGMQAEVYGKINGKKITGTITYSDAPAIPFASE